MKTPNLIEVPKAGLTRREKVKAFKAAHRIWTFRSPGICRADRPWSALLVPEGVEGHEIEHISRYAMRLEEAGDLVTRETEIGAIREVCQNNCIPCAL